MKNLCLLVILLGFCACTLSNEFEEVSLMPSQTLKVIPVPATLTPMSLVNQQIFRTPTIASPQGDGINMKELMIRQGPGKVLVPILLYHHIIQGKPTNSYSVTKANFIGQLNYLTNNGYQTITIDTLVRTISIGANLPKKPVIITFDDGNQDVFFNAYPSMKEMEFTGTVLVIANRIGAEGFFSVDQLLELAKNGWEIGSHGMRHVDLVKEPQALRDEIGNSKKDIEKKLNLKISIFAYPFGRVDAVTMDWVKQIGYKAALGLGISNMHDQKSLFYLQRREVKSDFSLIEFEKLLNPE